MQITSSMNAQTHQQHRAQMYQLSLARQTCRFIFTASGGFWWLWQVNPSCGVDS
jgi:hypothetical protein